MTLILGYVFPGRPSSDDVLRVYAPAGESYRIDWGLGYGTQSGKVASGDAYVDYTIPGELLDTGDISIGIDAGSNLTHVEQEEVVLGAVLYIDKKSVDCDGAPNAVNVNWNSYEEQGGPITRMTCGTYKWSGIFPDPLSWIGL